MEKEQLLKADYLDIIFDNRNKKYGGYILRRQYGNTSRKALLTVVSIIAAFASLSFVGSHNEGANSLVNKKVVEITDVQLPPKPLDPVKPPVQPPAAQKEMPKAQIKMTEMKVVDDNHVNEPPVEISKLNNAVVGKMNATGDSMGSDISLPKGKPEIAGFVDVPKNDKPYFVVEVMPEFQGSLRDFLSKHIVYPEEARSAHIEGRVAIQFVVNEDGSISEAKILKSVCSALDLEALRVVKSMPAWKPGKMNGKAVKVYFTQPISFKLD